MLRSIMMLFPLLLRTEANLEETVVLRKLYVTYTRTNMALLIAVLGLKLADCVTTIYLVEMHRDTCDLCRFGIFCLLVVAYCTSQGIDAFP